MARHISWIGGTLGMSLVLLPVCKGRESSELSAAPAGDRVVVVALNDVHGSYDPTPVTLGPSNKQQSVLAGGMDNLDSYLEILRKKFKDRVVVLDAGDAHQGTLISNYYQGRSMVAAYNALGVDASAVGNHEFDFGPLKLRDSEKGAFKPTGINSADRIGSFRALTQLAKFPFLTANVTINGAPLAQKGVPKVAPSTVIVKGGRRIGIVGATTTNTPLSGNPENLVGMKFIELSESVIAEAQRLRKESVDAVILVAHAGGSCRMNQPAPDGDKACVSPTPDEMTALLERAPRGTFDLVVAGHVHAPQAHYIRGTPVLQNYDGALSFARADLVFSDGKVKSEVIGHTYLCESHFKNYASCNPKQESEGIPLPANLGPAVAPSFLGETVKKQTRISQQLQPYLSEVSALLKTEIVRLPNELIWNRLDESPMGNCFADLMVAEVSRMIRSNQLKGVTSIEGAMFSSGGIRKGLPTDVRYGNVYAVAPFDGDSLSVVELPAKHTPALARVLGPIPKSILVVSEGWKAVVGPAGDNVARGVDAPDTLSDSPEQKVRILAFGYFVGNPEELPARMKVPAKDIRIIPVPGEARDHLESALKQSALPKACLAPTTGPVRTRRV